VPADLRSLSVVTLGVVIGVSATSTNLFDGVPDFAKIEIVAFLRATVSQEVGVVGEVLDPHSAIFVHRARPA